MSKFIQQVSRAITIERINQIKDDVVAPKAQTTEYLRKLEVAPNINTLQKFFGLKYQG